MAIGSETEPGSDTAGRKLALPPYFFEFIKRHTWAQALAVVTVGVIGFALLLVMRTSAPRSEVKKVAALVNTTEISPGSATIMLRGFGTVVAHKELDVRPQVSGHIVSMHPDLEVGGQIKEGEVLFKIDPRDYEIAVENQKAAVTRAEFQLQLEQGNQVVAKKEWELLQDGIQTTPLSKELALRKPHLKEKQAALVAAKSLLRKAELDLERTTVRAPFNSVVISETIEIGKYISQQQQGNQLRIAATDQFQVNVKLPQNQLSWIDTQNLEKTEVQVLETIKSDSPRVWKGKLARVLSNVDNAGRMAQLLIGVDNPLEGSPLLLGSYVQVQISGRQVDAVYSIPRKALREGDQIWVISADSTLAVKDVEVVFGDQQQLYVKGKELAPVEKLITSALPGALSGMLVKEL